MVKHKIRNFTYLSLLGLFALILIIFKFETGKDHVLEYPGLQEVKAITTRKVVTKSLSELNYVTPTLDEHTVFFNRIPKTGSEMFVLLMQWLQGMNGFKHVRLAGGKTRRLNRAQQADLIDEVKAKMQNEAIPLSFDRHVYFINFTSHGHQSPTYINLVRDPVQKAISRFYYSRATPNPKNPDLKHNHSPSSGSVKAIQDFEQCFTLKDPECTFEDKKFYDLTIPYFCGHNKWCMALNDEWALEEAKYNVEKYYRVVGVLEELNATLAVLEAKVPYFFKNVQDVYFKQLAEPHFNKNKYKPTINRELQKQVAEKLKLEYEFYYWVRQRLRRQFNAIFI